MYLIDKFIEEVKQDDEIEEVAEIYSGTLAEESKKKSGQMKQFQSKKKTSIPNTDFSSEGFSGKSSKVNHEKLKRKKGIAYVLLMIIGFVFLLIVIFAISEGITSDDIGALIFCLVSSSLFLLLGFSGKKHCKEYNRKSESKNEEMQKIQA